MSYILDALRKSETERKQGEIPDLGSAVQIIHKRRPGGSPLLVGGLALALLVNAGVLTWLFWPGANEALASTIRSTAGESAHSPADTPTQAPPPAVESQLLSADSRLSEQSMPEAKFTQPGRESAAPASSAPAIAIAVAARTAEPSPLQTASTERPPGQDEAGPESSQASPQPSQDDSEAMADPDRPVPALEATAAEFQRRIPDLTFNSHIFSSSPSSRRVMINNEYLREGASFSGMVVDEITEDGVILNLQGEKFSVSVVRDWIAPR